MDINIKSTVGICLKARYDQCVEAKREYEKNGDTHNVKLMNKTIADIEKAIVEVDKANIYAVVDEGVHVEILQVVNGREILRKHLCKDGKYVVLARYGNDFVRWGWDGEESFYWGHYYKTFYGALEDYNDKIKEC